MSVRSEKSIQAEDEYRKEGRWVDRFLARLFATVAIWVRIQTSLKNTKVGDISKGVANTL
jgi:hypothetical protein